MRIRVEQAGYWADNKEFDGVRKVTLVMTSVNGGPNHYTAPGWKKGRPYPQRGIECYQFTDAELGVFTISADWCREIKT